MRLLASLSRSAIVVVTIACIGCDEHAGALPVYSSMEEPTVKGVVRINGKAVTNGTDLSRCSNILRPSAPSHSAPIQKDGTYSITTVVGEIYVEVSCKELQTSKNRRYANLELDVKVASGETSIDLDLPPKTKTASR
ncbi:hypothetical protein ACYOEI_26190 [Singulisphaera rosea]